MRSMTVDIPLRAVSETNQREHWSSRNRRRKQQRGWTTLYLNSNRPPPLPVRVTLVRIAPRPLDTDNLWSSLKAFRDGVADHYEVDDNDEQIAWDVAQEKGEPKEYAVRINVEPQS